LKIARALDVMTQSMIDRDRDASAHAAGASA
jgi:hypothetical protein